MKQLNIEREVIKASRHLLIAFSVELRVVEALSEPRFVLNYNTCNFREYLECVPQKPFHRFIYRRR